MVFAKNKKASCNEWGGGDSRRTLINKSDRGGSAYTLLPTDPAHTLMDHGGADHSQDSVQCPRLGREDFG